MVRTRPILLTLDQQIELRSLRVDRLCRFLDLAVHHARRDPHSAWWRHHVAWAIRRLEALGYTFPEIDNSPYIRLASIPGHALPHADRLAA